MNCNALLLYDKQVRNKQQEYVVFFFWLHQNLFVCHIGHIKSITNFADDMNQ